MRVGSLVLDLVVLDLIMTVRSLLWFLGRLPLLVSHQALQELNLRHEEGTDEGSPLWFLCNHFLAHSLPDLVRVVRSMVRSSSLISWLTVLNSSVKIS